MIDLNAPKCNMTARQRLHWLRMIKACGGHYFAPTRPMFDFIRAVGTLAPDEKRVFLNTSGNGAGKTTTMVLILAELAIPGFNMYRNIVDVDTGEKIPGFFDFPLFHQWPVGWPKTCWYVGKAATLGEIQKEFYKWIPDHEIQKSNRKPQFVGNFKIRDWEIVFKTRDQHPDTFESANVSLLILDEPPPHKLYTAAVSRTRKGGIILMPATPLFASAWMKENLADKSEEPDSPVYWQTVSGWSNVIEKAGHWDLGKIGKYKLGIHPKGNLREADYVFGLNEYDPEEREAREHGIFMYLAGQVYKTWTDVRHELIYEREMKNQGLNTYIMVIDPHDRRPPAVLWAELMPEDGRYIWRDWPSREDKIFNGRLFHEIKSVFQKTLGDLIDDWIRIEEEMGIPNSQIIGIMDPNYGNKIDLRSGLTTAQIYSKLFRERGRPRGFITDVIDDIPIGHATVREALKIGLHGRAQLGMHPRCKNIDRSLQTYRYKDWSVKLAEENEVRETVQEKGKDGADLVRYLLMKKVSPRTPQISRGTDQYSINSWREKARQLRGGNRPKGHLAV